MSAPLADKIRPMTLDDVVGQRHILAPGKPLRNIIESGNIPNLIFYGPSGTGKTTVAGIIAAATDKKLFRLNGTSASINDVRDVVAQIGTVGALGGILLYLDEIQYFNKKQQQSLLEYIENGDITLIASTTENPYFYVYNAVLSRSTVFEFKYVTPEDIAPAVERAFGMLEAEYGAGFDIEEGVIRRISYSCGGDVRKAVNTAELLFLAAPRAADGEKIRITLENAEQLSQKTSMKYDRAGDEHYDIFSAFQKSMRGSDPDAALHYLARLLIAGDLAGACRRLAVCACEDVGLAYPQIIPIVNAAIEIAFRVGLPEARLPLADAVIAVCTAPKSNSGHDAINAAWADVEKGRSGAVPRNLQNVHYDGADVERKGQFYLYPHNYPNHWTAQQYLPDELVGTKYYIPGENKIEQATKEYWEKIKGES